MPALFDPENAKSREWQTLYALADRISECAQFIELSESADATEARTKIHVGAHEEQLDQDHYTREDLDNDFFFCRVAPQDVEGHEGVKADTVTECPREGGNIEVYLRRQVRDLEKNQTGGREDVYNFFGDRVSKIFPAQLAERIRATLVPEQVSSARRIAGPMFCDIAAAVAQGEYIWAAYVLEWGDLFRGTD